MRYRLPARILALALLFTWHAATLPVQAQADPAAVVQRFVAAVNRADVDGMLALFTDDGTIWTITGELCAPTACAGQAALRPEFERWVRIHARVTVLHTEVFGTTVVERAEVRDDVARSLGIDRYILIRRIETRGERIASLHATPDLTDPATARIVSALYAHPPALPAGSALAGATATAPTRITQLPRTLPRTGDMPVTPLGLTTLGGLIGMAWACWWVSRRRRRRCVNAQSR